ncbi:Strongly-conserved Zn-finger binding protein (TFIIIA) [Xylographa carneopallida]|nr:Strongly-conserved Zn-finger binding protein (TFIIIA) [Xylographa carneopallida]
MDSYASRDFPVRVAKRKADIDLAANLKKARQQVAPGVEDAKDMDKSSPGSSHVDDSSSSSEDEVEPNIVSTPSSPISSKPSPRVPSELKTKHCPYPDCSKSFNRQVRLNEHLRSHTNTRPYVCPHAPCTKDFIRSTHLKHHLKSAHSEIRDYECGYDGCGKRFATGTRLKRHHAAHEVREKHKCTVAGCEQTFRKHSTLQAHISSVHERTNRFVCEETDDAGRICEHAFDTAIKLKNHKNRIHMREKFQCTICKDSSSVPADGDSQILSLGFLTYNALMAHNKEVHPPICSYCGLQCATNNSLKTHLEIQHGALQLSDRKIHFCMETGCGRGFTKRGNLLVHIRTVHGNQRAFVCGTTDLSSINKAEGWQGADACGRAFTTKANLVEHICTAHLGLDHARKGKASLSKKKPKASTVGRLSGTAYDEEAHRDISCLLSDCDFRFGREYDLEIHMQSKHGLADFEIQILRAGRDGHGRSTSGYTLASERDDADMEAERALDEQFGMATMNEGTDEEERERDLAEALDEAAARGGQFWLRGPFDDGNMRDDWDAEEQDMRRPIGDGDEDEMDENDDGDEMVIDPALL